MLHLWAAAALVAAAGGYGPDHLPKVADEADPLVDATSLVPDLLVRLAYATADNLTGRALYPPGARCWLRKSAAERLARVQLALRPHGLRLIAWDCARSTSAQAALWKAHPHAGAVADPKRGSLHERGVAIDAAMAALDGSAVTLPTGFDDFSPRAAAKATLADATAMHHRDLLEAAMRAHGFRVNPKEWWHFSGSTGGDGRRRRCRTSAELQRMVGQVSCRPPKAPPQAHRPKAHRRRARPTIGDGRPAAAAPEPAQRLQRARIAPPIFVVLFAQSRGATSRPGQGRAARPSCRARGRARAGRALPAARRPQRAPRGRDGCLGARREAADLQRLERGQGPRRQKPRLHDEGVGEGALVVGLQVGLGAAAQPERVVQESGEERAARHLHAAVAEPEILGRRIFRRAGQQERLAERGEQRCQRARA